MSPGEHGQEYILHVISVSSSIFTVSEPLYTLKSRQKKKKKSSIKSVYWSHRKVQSKTELTYTASIILICEFELVFPQVEVLE